MVLKLYFQLLNNLARTRWYPGWQIQLQQKKVGEKLGGIEHVKSEIELAFEKLPENQKKLLSKYTTEAKLARAKFLAFYGR